MTMDRHSGTSSLFLAAATSPMPTPPSRPPSSRLSAPQIKSSSVPPIGTWRRMHRITLGFLRLCGHVGTTRQRRLRVAWPILMRQIRSLSQHTRGPKFVSCLIILVRDPSIYLTVRLCNHEIIVLKLSANTGTRPLFSISIFSCPYPMLQIWHRHSLLLCLFLLLEGSW